MGIEFELRAADVEELEQGAPDEVAVQNAARKAAVVADAAGDSLVLGVDTVVALDGRIYGKPSGPAEARETLLALSGRRHQVISGLYLGAPGSQRAQAASTIVEFRALHERLIAWYVESGEWRGRAGGYAIQGRGAALVRRIEGDYLNVVGLPLALLLDLAPELVAGGA